MERLLTPQEEKNFTIPSRDGLRDVIFTMVSAGNDTIGITSMVGIYQIIRNPAIQPQLLAELKTVLPESTSEAPYIRIEKLPYLSAVIKESLRYASAAASRTPSLVPTGEFTCRTAARFPPAHASAWPFTMYTTTRTSFHLRGISYQSVGWMLKVEDRCQIIWSR